MMENAKEAYPCTRRTVVFSKRLGSYGPAEDSLAEEVPVALVYNGISHAVMMATPADLEEFAVGFSLTEGIVRDRSEIYGIDVLPACRGLRVELEISSERFMRLKERRRAMTGRTGCGLCGVDQLSEVIRPVAKLPSTASFSLRRIDHALAAMRQRQLLGDETGCTHAAALVSEAGDVIACFEDVGRHVALDKLLGARALSGPESRLHQSRIALVSSRASYEMVQKAASCGIEVLLTVSAATGLAVETAQKCGLTLVSFCRPGRATVLSRPDRIRQEEPVRATGRTFEPGLAVERPAALAA